MPRLRAPWWLVLLPFAAIVPLMQSQGDAASEPEPIESIQYEVEWRFVRAGTAKLTRTPAETRGWYGDLTLQAVGIVSKLYHVEDRYRVRFDGAFCAAETRLLAEEGNRRRDTRIVFHRDAKKLHYLERDLTKDKVILEKELDTPLCTHDVVAALSRLRAMDLDPGDSAEIPVTDGKRLVQAKIEAQARQSVKTPAGTFNTVRYQAYLFNDVLYRRKGNLYLWLTDDERKLPVKIEAKLSFPIGSITLQAEKIKP